MAKDSEMVGRNAVSIHTRKNWSEPPIKIDRILSGLTPEQREAATSNGPALVLAGAGTGKTRALTSAVARRIADGVPPWRILAVTFTNKAAGEMRDRISGMMG